MYPPHDDPEMIPGLAGLAFRNLRQKQREKVKKHMGLNPFVLAMVEKAKLQSGLDRLGGLFQFHMLFIPQSDVFWTQVIIASGKGIFPIQMLFSFYVFHRLKRLEFSHGHFGWK
jgi:hypothetical protein